MKLNKNSRSNNKEWRTTFWLQHKVRYDRVWPFCGKRGKKERKKERGKRRDKQMGEYHWSHITDPLFLSYWLYELKSLFSPSPDTHAARLNAKYVTTTFWSLSTLDADQDSENIPSFRNYFKFLEWKLEKGANFFPQQNIWQKISNNKNPWKIFDRVKDSFENE